MADLGALIDLTVETPPNPKETTKSRDTHQSAKNPPRLASAPATTNHSQRLLGSSSRHSKGSRNSSGFSKQASKVFPRPQTLASAESRTSRLQDTSTEDIQAVERSPLPGLRKPGLKTVWDVIREHRSHLQDTSTEDIQAVERSPLPGLRKPGVKTVFDIIEEHRPHLQDMSTEDIQAVEQAALPGLRKPSTKSFVGLTRDEGGHRAQSQPHKHQFMRQTLPEIRRHIPTDSDSEEDPRFSLPLHTPSCGAERNESKKSDSGKMNTTSTSSPSFKIPEAGILKTSPLQDLEVSATPSMENTADWAALRSAAQKSATEAAISNRKHWDALASTIGRTAAGTIPDSPRQKQAASDLSGLAGATKEIEPAPRKHCTIEQLLNVSNGSTSESEDESESESEDEANHDAGNGDGNAMGEAFSALFTLSGTDEKVNTRKSLMNSNIPSGKFSVRQNPLLVCQWY